MVDATLANPSTAAELRAIVDRVRRLMPMRRDPEAFHVERDAVAVRLLAIANALDPSPNARIRRPEKLPVQPGLIRKNGRVIPVVLRSTKRPGRRHSPCTITAPTGRAEEICAVASVTEPPH